MNSQFKNSSLGFHLYAVIIIIIAAASIFVFWYMVKGYKLGTYPEDTILGSVYIGGIEEDDVEAKLIPKIERWLNDRTIVFEVTYQGYSYEFDRELFYFDYETSIYFIDVGETNELVVTYQGTVQQDVIDEIKDSIFLEGIEENFDLDQLVIDILDDASFMRSYSSKNLEDYIIDDTVSYVEISSIDLDILEGISIDDMIAGVNIVYLDSKIMINSKELFDISEKFGTNLTETEMTILSTGMLSLILETNFAINEVHYIPKIDYINYDIITFPDFGHNASVNHTIENSFSFYNPNNSNYYFTLVKIDDTKATLTLHGLEFVDTIVVTVERVLIEHITQTTNDDNILQAGYDGMIIEVTRKITNIYGLVTYEKVIIFEFYPPIKEIILGP